MYSAGPCSSRGNTFLCLAMHKCLSDLKTALLALQFCLPDKECHELFIGRVARTRKTRLHLFDKFRLDLSFILETLDLGHLPNSFFLSTETGTPRIHFL